MLKIFEKSAETAEPVPYLFHFNSPSDPRAEANVIRDLLSRLIADAKSNDPNVPRLSSGPATPAGAGSSSSVPTTSNNAANSKSTMARLFDGDALKLGATLQPHQEAAELGRREYRQARQSLLEAEL